MPYRVTFFFQFQGDRLAGWSENYWNNLADTTALNNAIQALGNKLMLVKAAGVQWTRTRVSIPGSPRNSYTLLNVPINQFPPVPGSNTSSADYQQTKWLLQLTHAPFPANQPGQNSTRQWFGGITDTSVQNAQYQPNNPAYAIFNQLVGLLSSPANGWIMWQLNPAFPANPIIAINNTTGVVTTANAISFGTATLVRVSRVRNLTAANGLWTWQPIVGANNQVQLLNWTPQTNIMMTSPKATIRPQIYAQQTIVSASIVRSSNHKAGRPTGQFGGRRKPHGVAK
jgi:hypothetical protein